MMEKNEALYRALATRIWEEAYPAEHVQSDTGRDYFLNVVSVGIAAGVRAYALVMEARQAGNIDDLYVIFEEPRIV
jgi:hypothetical protein